jgi:hypothetical protein
MEPSRTPPYDVLAEVPAISGQVRPESPARRSLADSLGPTVDRIRQLRTDMGLAPYRVFLVHWRWPSKRGLGRPVEIARDEVLPNPKISDMTGTLIGVAAFGATEGGGLFVSKISTKYSENDLLGRTPDLVDSVRPKTSASNVEFFWEVQLARGGSKPRRYIPQGVPMLDRSGIQWKISVIKQSESYDGEPEVAS